MLVRSQSASPKLKSKASPLHLINKKFIEREISTCTVVLNLWRSVKQCFHETPHAEVRQAGIGKRPEIITMLLPRKQPFTWLQVHVCLFTVRQSVCSAVFSLSLCRRVDRRAQPYDKHLRRIASHLQFSTPFYSISLLSLHSSQHIIYMIIRYNYHPRMGLVVRSVACVCVSVCLYVCVSVLLML